jgi:hypothetical protein
MVQTLYLLLRNSARESSFQGLIFSKFKRLLIKILSNSQLELNQVKKRHHLRKRSTKL